MILTYTNKPARLTAYQSYLWRKKVAAWVRLSLAVIFSVLVAIGLGVIR